MENLTVIYTRVSTDQQAKEGVSLDMQLARCMEYCEKQGLTVLDTVVDAGVSAKSIAGRHGFEKIMDLIRHRKVRHVVTYKLDRAFRNTVEGLGCVELMNRKGCALHIVDEHGAVRTESADDEFLLALKMSLAQRERKLVSERTKAALARKRERGEFTGGEAPYGYRNEGGKVVPEMEEQRTIAKVRKLRKAGHSIRRIVGCLEQDGCVSRSGRPFGKTQVERILKAA
jgi:DNA invertase Pin-like site-specific DNA recombinase